ncbi:MAG: hypothetical protein AAF847_18470, partial [Bacteroidota bacterium]
VPTGLASILIFFCYLQFIPTGFLSQNIDLCFYNKIYIISQVHPKNFSYVRPDPNKLLGHIDEACLYEDELLNY